MRRFMTKLVILLATTTGQSLAQDGQEKEYTIGEALKGLAKDHESEAVRDGVKDLLDALSGEVVPPKSRAAFDAKYREAMAAKFKDEAKAKDGALVWTAVFAVDMVPGYMMLDYKKTPPDSFFTFDNSARAMETLELLKEIGKPAVSPTEALRKYSDNLFEKTFNAREDALDEDPAFEHDQAYKDLTDTMNVAIQLKLLADEVLGLIQADSEEAPPAS